MNTRAKVMTWSSAVAGAAVFVMLMVAYDVGEITSTAASAGWGLLWICLFRLVLLSVDSAAWHRLVARHHPTRLWTLARFRWVGESVNTLLPVAQVGGEVVRARLLAIGGMPASKAGASVVVDFTIGLFAQIVFTLIGIELLLTLVAPEAQMGTVIVGILVAAILVGAFYAVQRLGLFATLGVVLAKLGWSEGWSALAGLGAELDRAVNDYYGRYGDLLVAGLWRLTGWLLSVFEVWLALYFIGVPVGVAEAVVIESLVTAVRGATFFVPGALGTQEGGLVIIGAMIGLAPETALALGLIKRFREVVVGSPGLFAWAHAERRGLGDLLARIRG